MSIIAFITCEYDNYELDMNVLHLRCSTNRKTFYELSLNHLNFPKTFYNEN